MDYNPQEHKLEYLTFHGERARFLLETLKNLKISTADSVLDVGRSPLTAIVQKLYPNVSTLGLDPELTLLDKADPLDLQIIPHKKFDLNLCPKRELWILPEKYKVILFNEIIEHLQVSPKWVFKYLKELMHAGGYLIVQTPNAVSLGKRIRICRVQNPFVEFETDAEIGSHHFREYTKKELIKHALEAGLILYRHEFVNYFPSRNLLFKFINSFCGIIPAFRNGQTMIFQNPA